MKDDSATSIERRNLILGAGALLGSAAVAPVFAAEEMHHHHGDNRDDALLRKAMACVQSSQLCIAHCLNEFKQGNTDMADCARAAQESSAMCEAFWALASLGSQHLKKASEACIATCETCEKACDEFADKHDVCKECRDACRELVKQIKLAV